jgi:hypothetical protein
MAVAAEAISVHETLLACCATVAAAATVDIGLVAVIHAAQAVHGCWIESRRSSRSSRSAEQGVRAFHTPAVIVAEAALIEKATMARATTIIVGFVAVVNPVDAEGRGGFHGRGGGLEATSAQALEADTALAVLKVDAGLAVEAFRAGATTVDVALALRLVMHAIEAMGLVDHFGRGRGAECN